MCSVENQICSRPRSRQTGLPRLLANAAHAGGSASKCAAMETDIPERVFRRFWERVIQRGPDECWGWNDKLGPNGYPTIYFYNNGKNRSIKGHRLSFLIHNGHFPLNGCACHKCDNPECTNPNHLFDGSIADNNRDMTSKGRHWETIKTHCKRGHPFSEENTKLIVRKRGTYRQCIMCKYMLQKGYVMRRKERSKCAQKI